MYHVAAFYHFTRIDDLAGHQQTLLAAGNEIGVCGTILVAPEGINSTIAAEDEQAIRAYVQNIARTYGFDFDLVKWSTAAEKPFGKFKVRPKKEIITMKRPEADPIRQTGVHVPPAEWNALIAQPDVFLIDTRNDYEVEAGTFAGAVDPVVKTFTEWADYVDKNMDPSKTPKVAMFCTGGIRCEKASSYLLAKGFAEVYQLSGGILKYLEEIPAEQSTWNGSCFVFDKRVGIGHGLTTTPMEWCQSCHAMAYPAGESCPQCQQAAVA